MCCFNDFGFISFYECSVIFIIRIPITILHCPLPRHLLTPHPFTVRTTSRMPSDSIGAKVGPSRLNVGPMFISSAFLLLWSVQWRFRHQLDIGKKSSASSRFATSANDRLRSQYLIGPMSTLLIASEVSRANRYTPDGRPHSSHWNCHRPDVGIKTSASAQFETSINGRPTSRHQMSYIYRVLVKSAEIWHIWAKSQV